MPPPHSLEPQPFAVAGQPVEGTLYLPEGEGWYPAAVLAGSPAGQALTHALLGAGYAVLTFDAPGADLGAAALAAADSLLMRPDIRPELIGLVGFGPGAWAAAYVAGRAPETGFAVLVPGETPPTAEALAHLAGVACPALALSPSAALTATLAAALAGNPEGEVRSVPAGEVPAVVAAWLAGVGS